MLPFPIAGVQAKKDLSQSLTRRFYECEIARSNIDFRTKVNIRQVIESSAFSSMRFSTFISALQAGSRLFNKIIPASRQMVEI